MISNQAISILSDAFDLDYSCHNQDIFISKEEYFLDVLQNKIESLLEEHNREYFESLENIQEIQRALLSLTYSELISITYGIDYNLELRSQRPYVTKENYSVIYHYLVTLPKFGDEGLKSENHGHGYHIHYVIIKKLKQVRTDILLTFNPNETTPVTHTLYWENHGSAISRHPDKFGKRRRLAIYDSSCGFLSKIKKTDFRRPSTKSEKLWPQ